MRLLYLTFFNIAFISSSFAQKLDLFQEVERVEDEGARTPNIKKNIESESTPIFTVRGISRFGEKYLVSLSTNVGSSLTIEWDQKRNSMLEGFPNYSIVNVYSRHVALLYPENIGCVEFPDKGISCNGPYMLLKMTNSNPIEQNNILETTLEPEVRNQVEAEVQLADSEEVRFFKNPFSGEMQEIPKLSPEEQARRDERRQKRAEIFRDFEIVRIPDDDIPEGMQRIRTPFGDSLEPLGSD